MNAYVTVYLTRKQKFDYSTLITRNFQRHFEKGISFSKTKVGVCTNDRVMFQEWNRKSSTPTDKVVGLTRFYTSSEDDTYMYFTKGAVDRHMSRGDAKSRYNLYDCKPFVDTYVHQQ
jgi:hypothetical protein